MRKLLALVLAWQAAAGLGADPGPAGEVLVRTAGGRLAAAESRWSVGDDLEARAWWREAGGAGWLRFAGVQTGPLEARVGPGGEWAWGPGTTLAEGSWGAWADGGPAGLWLVQTPGRLVLGGQARAVWDGGRFFAGLSRTWDDPAGPAQDEVRAGLRWDDPHLPGAVEARWFPGAAEGRLKLRQTWKGQGFRWAGEAAAEGPPARPEFSGSAEAGWGPVGLEARWLRGGAPGRFAARADLGPLSAGPRWTSAGGWGGEGEVSLGSAKARGRVRAEADAAVVRGSLGLTGTLPAGAGPPWSAEAGLAVQSDWAGVWKLEASAGAEAGPLSVRAAWTRTDPVLGWLGEGSEVGLTAVWRY